MLYIATLNEIKAEIGIADAEDDVGLTTKAEGLQGRFDDHLQRTLLRGADVEEIFDGDYTWLTPTRYPIESVAHIYVDADAVFGADTEISSSDYRLNKRLGRIAYMAGQYKWAAGMQNIKVVYTGGYVAAGTVAASGQVAMPETIRRLFFMQLGFEWRNKTTLGNQSVSAQGASVSLAPAKFLPEVEEGLSIYKRF